MERREKILLLFDQFRKHKKWNSFYLKSIQSLIHSLLLPPGEVIECSIDELSQNEEFCLPLFISRDDLFYPSIVETFKNSLQNQTVAILNFNAEQDVDNLAICYLHKNQLTYLEIFKL
ncbi:MAG TPA: hypothetical protein VIG94_03730 [Faecalibacter sp.]